MPPSTYLAGDLGGTKTLLSLYSTVDGQLQSLHGSRYASAEWTSLEAMLDRFLQDLPSDLPRPTTSCIAVAGPVQRGEAKLTNLPWLVSETSLCAASGLERLELVNDFAVLIHGLPHFSEGQQVVLQEGQASAGPVAILGAGTGLGMARGIPGPDGWIALASEGGHREFAPRTETEWALSHWLKADLELDRLSVERIVSGTGLGHVMHWLLQREGSEGHPLQPHAKAWRRIPADQAGHEDLPAHTGRAAAVGDPLAREALDLWLGAYGSAAGDLALHELCRGGLWVGGGTAEKNIEGLRSDRFLEPLRCKGRFRSFLESLTIRAVIDPQAGLYSAACRARELGERQTFG
jgi:glucokinase